MSLDTAQLIEMVGAAGMVIVVLSPIITVAFVRKKWWLPVVGAFWFVVAANIFIARSIADPISEYASTDMLAMENRYIDAELMTNIVVQQSDDKALKVVALPLPKEDEHVVDGIPLPIPSFVRLRLGAMAWPALATGYAMIFWLVGIESLHFRKRRRAGSEQVPEGAETQRRA